MGGGVGDISSLTPSLNSHDGHSQGTHDDRVRDLEESLQHMSDDARQSETALADATRHWLTFEAAQVCVRARARARACVCERVSL